MLTVIFGQIYGRIDKNGGRVGKREGLLSESLVSPL